MNLVSATSTLSVLADPTRLRLLSVLGQGSLSVTELSACLGLSQPRVSHHLSILLRANLVRVRREGARAFYTRESQGEQRRVAEAALGLLDDPTVKSDLEEAARLVADRKAARRGFFAALARTWPANLAAWIDVDAYRDLVSQMLPRTGSVADVGCGTGWLLPTLSSAAAVVIGVDHAPEVIAEARRRAQEWGLTACQFRLGEAEHLPLKDREVAAVFFGLVLHCTPDPQAALEEAARVCSPGGALVVIEPSAHQNDRARDELGAMWLGFAEEDMLRWVDAAGFDGAATQVRAPERGLSLLAVRARRA